MSLSKNDSVAHRLGEGSSLWGRYTVLAEIGRGGMATVYEAVHRNGKHVALKVLHHELALHPPIVERFYGEGRASQSVKHSGVVDVYDDGQSVAHEHVLVCELLDGCTLRQWSDAADGALPVDEVLGYLDEALLVLAAAHRVGVVHRDIKPDNLFLTTEGRLKLLDFGVARVPADASSTPTRDGQMLGTPAFMSPEQARGHTPLVSAQSDLWSLAATGVALLSGRAPREASTVNEVLLLAMTQPLPPVASLCPGLSPQVCSVLDRALAMAPEARYASAEDMRVALLRARRGDDAECTEPLVSPKSALSAMPTGSGISWTLRAHQLSIGFGVLLVLVAVAGTVATRGPRGPADPVQAAPSSAGAAEALMVVPLPDAGAVALPSFAAIPSLAPRFTRPRAKPAPGGVGAAVPVKTVEPAPDDTRFDKRH